jgi:UDP-glucose 4-epimerase
VSTVLVTGGAGYIGTHLMTALGASGHRCISIDNHTNSSPEAVERARRLTTGAIAHHEIDIRDTGRLRRLVAGQELDAVVHLAGLKSVRESVESPDHYYDNNVRGTRCLLEVLAHSRVRRFVFSSSATVYGLAETMPITESAPTAPQNPYGENKLAIERMLAQLVRDDPSWSVINLRYFNPVGAHESGTIGENPTGTPNNLMPYICQVATGQRDSLRIFGRDYPTPDGTGVRDYIHVMDLAEAHVAALHALERSAPATLLTTNIGTGRGHSVLELVNAFERVNGVPIKRVFVDRRPGDVAVSFADCSLARSLLGWSSRRGVDDMCRDAWRWQRQNPEGFGGPASSSQKAIPA